MQKLNGERVAAFSAAIEEVYKNIQAGKKINFSAIGRKHGLKSHTPWLKKALRDAHLINEDATKWNPAYTLPNDKLATTIYSKTKEYVNEANRESLKRRKERLRQQEKEDIPEIHDANYLTLEETVANVKHYGLFKVILKCLFC